jgi:hypothetical protein
VVGANWRASRSVVVPLAVHSALTGLMTSWLAGLRVLEAARDALAVRIVVTPLYLGAVAFGLLWQGAPGAAVAMACVSAVGAELMRRRFTALYRVRGGDGSRQGTGGRPPPSRTRPGGPGGSARG